MKRMWINQPSKNQPLHSYHGVKVLSDLKPEFEGSTSCRVYFTEGNVISMSVPLICLGGGWPAYEPQGILERYQKLMYVVDGAREAHYRDNLGEERDWLRHCYNQCDEYNNEMISKHLNGVKE